MSNIDKSNLMNHSTLTNVKQVSAVTSETSKKDRQFTADGGKETPSIIEADKPAKANKKEITQAAKDIFGYVQNITRELNFSVDEELGKTVITVIDDETGDVIRQIPNEDILQLAREIANMKDSTSTGILFKGDA